MGVCTQRRIVHTGTAEVLLADREIQERYCVDKRGLARFSTVPRAACCGARPATSAAERQQLRVQALAQRCRQRR